MKASELAYFIKHRYGTTDPWKLADVLNIDVRWTEALSSAQIGRTTWIIGQPVIFIAKAIKGLPMGTRVLAHELGHVLLHEQLEYFYSTSFRGRDRCENEANVFAWNLLLLNYYEEHGFDPDATIGDIGREYGFREDEIM